MKAIERYFEEYGIYLYRLYGSWKFVCEMEQQAKAQWLKDGGVKK